MKQPFLIFCMHNSLLDRNRRIDIRLHKKYTNVQIQCFVIDFFAKACFR